MAEIHGYKKHYRMTGDAVESQGVAKGAGVTQGTGKSGVPSNSYNKEIKIPKGGSANVKEAK